MKIKPSVVRWTLRRYVAECTDEILSKIQRHSFSRKQGSFIAHNAWYVVRCYAYRQGGEWVAGSPDLGVEIAHEAYTEATRRLHCELVRAMIGKDPAHHELVMLGRWKRVKMLARYYATALKYKLLRVSAQSKKILAWKYEIAGDLLEY
jgi:hypothetical protein